MPTRGQYEFAALALLLAVSGCARSSPPGAGWDELATALAGEPSAAAASELRVRLVFGAGGDLDLFLTEPNQETVYFANTPSLSGGSLERDQTCRAPAPRIERISFPSPQPGRYRVGVDYPQPCPGHGGPVPFWIEVEHDGRRQTQRGEIEPRVFLPIVLEFALP